MNINMLQHLIQPKSNQTHTSYGCPWLIARTCNSKGHWKADHHQDAFALRQIRATYLRFEMFEMFATICIYIHIFIDTQPFCVKTVKNKSWCKHSVDGIGLGLTRVWGIWMWFGTLHRSKVSAFNVLHPCARTFESSNQWYLKSKMKNQEKTDLTSVTYHNHP